MEIYVTQARRRIKSCGRKGLKDRVQIGCLKFIEMGEIIARGVWWYDKKRWQRSWHFECWATPAVIQAGGAIEIYISTVNLKPSITRGTLGRPALDLTKEDRKQRRLLLVKASKLRKQRYEEISLLSSQGWMDEFYSRNEVFIGKLRSVWDQLILIGGPPDKSFNDWLDYTPVHPIEESQQASTREMTQDEKDFADRFDSLYGDKQPAI